MNGSRRIAVPIAVAMLATVVAAVQAPLWTYALSLALFGLPHVLVELRYVDERFAARLPRSTILGLGTLLAGIVVLRLLAAAGCGAPLARTTAELALGALLVAATLPALARVHRAPIAGATLGVLALGLATAPFDTLIVLAVLHNLTPVGFLAERLRGRERRRALWLAGLAFGAVPLCIATGAAREALGPWFGGWHDAGPFGTGTLDLHLPVFVLPALLGSERAIDVFAAAVYLQCLHYAVVLHVLPRLSGGSETGQARVPWQRGWFRPALLGGSLLATTGFVAGFADTRAIYAIVAALHAWIEIPLLLLACGVAPRGEAALARVA